MDVTEIGIANLRHAKDVPVPLPAPKEQSTAATVIKCREEDPEELFLTPQCDTRSACKKIRYIAGFLVLKAMQPKNKFPEHFPPCRGASSPSSGSDRPDEADMTDLMNRDVQQMTAERGRALNDPG